MKIYEIGLKDDSMIKVTKDNGDFIALIPKGYLSLRGNPHPDFVYVYINFFQFEPVYLRYNEILKEDGSVYGNSVSELLMNIASTVSFEQSKDDILQNGNNFGVPINIGSKDNFALNFKTNNINRFLIKNDGTINIPAFSGTTGKYLTLDSAGNLIIVNLPSTINNILQNGNSFATNMTIGTNNNFDLNLETNNIVRFLIKNDGNINIPAFSGNTGKYLTLDVDGNIVPTTLLTTDNLLQGGNSFGTDMNFGTNDNFVLNLKTNNVNRLVLKEDGTINIPTFSGNSGYYIAVDSLGNLILTAPAGGGANTLLQGGNSFGTAINFGSSDNFDLKLKTNNLSRIIIKNNGTINLPQFIGNNGDYISADSLGNLILVPPSGLPVFNEQTHSIGATVTISNDISILYINPVSTLANLTITMPSTPTNGQEVKVSFGGLITSGTVVTTLSIIGNTGHTILAGTSISNSLAGDGYIFKYQTASNLWRIF